MSFFIQPTYAPKPRGEATVPISVLYAGILTVMAVGQLFTFEEFLSLLQTFDLPMSEAMAYVLAPVIVVCEVLALPFLLRMSLSPAFRWLSMILGWLVPAFWLFLSVWVLASGAQVETFGFIGTVVSLTPGVVGRSIEPVAWGYCGLGLVGSMARFAP
ncbi:hypothetical protein LRY29_01655 [Candidatus Saccharibacteria bacterium]|nr:hypothetical protein [Candidatus Saccharibacteria bacterium]